MEQKYCVANYKGELAGHDLSKDKAEFLLNKMVTQEPDEEWEMMAQ